MSNNLDASNFRGTTLFYDSEFEEILSKITICYQLMKRDKVPLVNKENDIRTYLLIHYLKNDDVRKSIDLCKWHFEKEISEDHSVGRTDIKIISQNTFHTQQAYYIIECKRLDNINTSGTSGLNAHYVKEGIVRFTSKYYSSYHRVNGMIGFIVANMDIHTNVANINNLLLNSSFTSINTIQKLTKDNFLKTDNFIEDFEFQYSSIHKDKENQPLRIYHLMFDFHEHITSA